MELVQIERSRANFKPVYASRLNHEDGITALIQQHAGNVPVIVNRKTMHCINGHILEAYRKNETLEYVPVIFIEIDRAHEFLFAVSINGGLDGFNVPTPTDTDKFITALERASNEQIKTIAPFDYIADIVAYYAQVQTETTTEPPALASPAPAYKNYFDIPELDINRQGMPTGATFTRWGSRSRSAPHEAIHFYTDDYKFNALEGKPETIPLTGAKTVIELNYSTEPSHPRAITIYNTWKKRTASTIWQGEGVNVIVDMNVNRQFFDINLLGVPAGWTAYANRYYSGDEKHLYDAYQRAQQHAQTDNIDYFVYGGQTARILCDANNWTWITSEVEK